MFDHKRTLLPRPRASIAWDCIDMVSPDLGSILFAEISYTIRTKENLDELCTRLKLDDF